MKNRKITIITQSHLCRNPRVVKEALSFAGAGYQVTILNSTYDGSLTREDMNLISGHQIRLISIARLEINSLSSFIFRLFKKAGCALVGYFNIQTPFALGYASWQYFSVAMKQKADLYICHQELGLFCGVQLLRAKKKVAFDFEDWYSEDLPDAARRSRPVKLLKKLEKVALHEGAFCVTTSAAMATELARTYGSRAPGVIYNAFDTYEPILSRSKFFTGPLKLLWFSQTIGAGRGLEEFLHLASQLETRPEIHLLGNVDVNYAAVILDAAGTYPVFFHPLVPSKELAERIADFDIGLALENIYPLSRNLTITNKFFQYIESGLPVISTSTLGQLEVFSDHSPGFLIESYESAELVKKLDNWLKNKEGLNNARAGAIRLAHQHSRSRQYDKLLKLVKNVF